MSEGTISLSPSSTRDFPIFTRFPREIRFKIWEEACFFPRHLFLWAIPIGQFLESETYYGAFRYITTTPPPTILKVSREARKIGLENYKLEFGIERTLAHGIKINIAPRIYVNWRSDIICPMEMRQFTSEVLGDFWVRYAMEMVAVNVLEEPDSDFYFPLLPAIKAVLLYGCGPIGYGQVQFLAENAFFDFVEFDEERERREARSDAVAGDLKRIRGRIEEDYRNLEQKQKIWEETVGKEWERPRGFGELDDELCKRRPRPVINLVHLKVIWNRDRGERRRAV